MHTLVIGISLVLVLLIIPNWKMSERWYRDSWTGNVKRERTWKMFYIITAQWVHPQTGHSHTSSTRICSDSMSKPVEGDSGIVWFDPHNPERSCLDLRDRGMELHTAMNEASTLQKGELA